MTATVLRSVVRLLLRAKSQWHLQKSRYDTYVFGGALEIGSNVQFVVPLRIDGPGKVFIGADSALGFQNATRFGNGEILLQARRPESTIRIGTNCHFSNNITVIACQEVVFGADCLIGDGVTVYDSDFHDLSPDQRFKGVGKCAPVAIGNNVWIGSRAMVFKGVTIGDNSVVAPMSVVTRDIPENVLAAGVPARKVQDLV